MITVITLGRAEIYQYNPRTKGYTKKGVCFKAKGASVQVEKTEDPRFLRIVEDKKATSLYLRTEDVAVAAAA